MDQLDHNLLAAWWRVWGRLERDAGEARRRWARTHGVSALSLRRGGDGTPTYARPPRAWCLALRASDTRIDAKYGYGTKWRPLAPGSAGGDESRGLTAGQASSVVHPRQSRGLMGAEATGRHLVMLGPEDVRAWCAPVRVAWPGVPLDVAAARLGRHREVVRKWLPKPGGVGPGGGGVIGRDADGGYGVPRQVRRRRGMALGVDATRAIELGEDYVQPGNVWGVRYERGQEWGRHSGGAVPVVWTRRAVDPQHRRGDRPHGWWGSLWETLAERWPMEAGVSLDRVARWRRRPGGPAVRSEECLVSSGVGVSGTTEDSCFAGGPQGPACGEAADGSRSGFRDSRGDLQFRGWAWVCEGVDGQGCVRGAGHTATTVVCPLPRWTLAAALADDPRVAAGLDIGGGERWWPTRSVHPAETAAGGMRFACERCWGVRRQTTDARGWNDVVSYITGGVLMGREVERVG
ncbi:MAG: hypothetical protein AAGK09_00675 [Planctomycetota bacterium]